MKKGSHHQTGDHNNSQKLDDMNDEAIEQIMYLLDIGQGRSQPILSFNQVLDYIEQDNQQDTLFNFRAIVRHQGPQEREYRN